MRVALSLSDIAPNSSGRQEGLRLYTTSTDPPQTTVFIAGIHKVDPATLISRVSLGRQVQCSPAVTIAW